MANIATEVKTALTLMQAADGRAIALSKANLKKVRAVAEKRIALDLTAADKLTDANIIKFLGTGAANEVERAQKNITEAYEQGIKLKTLKMRIQEDKKANPKGWKQWHKDNAKSNSLYSYSYSAKLMQIADAGPIVTKTDELGRPWGFNTYYAYQTKGSILSTEQLAAHKKAARAIAKEEGGEVADVAITEETIKVSSRQTACEKVEARWMAFETQVGAYLYTENKEGETVVQRISDKKISDYIQGCLVQLTDMAADIKVAVKL